jgi:hypothetical protein
VTNPFFFSSTLPFIETRDNRGEGYEERFCIMITARGDDKGEKTKAVST